jgi:hypothetical protein
MMPSSRPSVPAAAHNSEHNTVSTTRRQQHGLNAKDEDTAADTTDSCSTCRGWGASGILGGNKKNERIAGLGACARF